MSTFLQTDCNLPEYSLQIISPSVCLLDHGDGPSLANLELLKGGQLQSDLLQMLRLIGTLAAQCALRSWQHLSCHSPP